MAGVVIDLGADTNNLRSGMAVACGGVSAGHAEYASIPTNLAVRIPDDVSHGDA